MNLRGILVGRRSRLIAAGAASILLLLALVAATTSAWATGLADDDRLLPGTVVAGVDIGGHTLDDATAAVTAALDDDLDRRLRVAYGDHQWTTSPRALAARVDVAGAVAAAAKAGASLGVVELAAIRWLDVDGAVVVDAAITVPDARLGVFARQLAAEIDVEAREAAIRWDGSQLEVTPSVTGLRVEHHDTVERLRRAIADGSGTVEAAVTVTPPQVSTELARGALPPVRAAVSRTLDREITVTGADVDRRVSARDLEATPVVDELADAAYAAATQTRTQTLGPGHALGVDVDLALDGAAIDAYVAALADEIEVAATDARLDWSSGWVERIPGSEGIALDRDRAAADLRAALRGEVDTVELETLTTRPAVTLDDYRHVVLVRQNERMLYRYLDGEITHRWPVAVGTSGQPTPTGEFRVGWKRYMPTWRNPAPEGWGRDMPEEVEPGPNNPLGVRALNWNRDGRDTLIRFHGTAAAHTIGNAASAGCVRLTNDDVAELFDLVPNGAAIVSIHGPAPEQEAGSPSDELVDGA